MHSEKVRKPCILAFLLSFLIICVIFDSNLLFEISNINFENEKNLPIPNYSSTSEYSGVGSAQNVTEYGEGFFQNNNLNVTNLENASIIVPDTWEANEIAVNITNIYEYDRLWMNHSFDNGFDENSWTNHTDPSKTDYLSFNWYNDPIGSNDSLCMKFINASTYWDDIDSYWNFTFNLDRENIPYIEWSINFNYRFLTNNSEWLSAGGGTKFYSTIIVNDKTTQFNLPKFDTHVNDTWYSDNIEPFSPELYEYDPPGTVSVLFGVYWGKNIFFNPTGYLELFFDNITLNLQTIPKPSQINLTLTDIEHGIIKQIDDISGYGLGNTTLKDSWAGSVGGKEHRFSFASNSSGKVYINSDFFVKANSSRFTTTEIGEKGSEFCTKNETRTVWTMYFPVVIPGSYQTNYYFNVSKPINWNVTHLFDPYGSDKISQVLETSGIGNSTLVIPNEIIVNGRWKIVAESPNYVLTTKIWKWNETDTSWEESTNFETYDVIKINCTIDNDLISNLESTNASLLVYYPNNTEWSQAYQEIAPDFSGNVEFNNFTLGALNASAGEYILNIKWNNINSSQIGFSSLNFENTHNTILDRANDQEPIVTPIYTGDTILIKVNYTDIDIGVGIIGAYVNYTIDNETAITGDTVYFGGGIYIAEIDTINWQNGLYNVSISAEKPYYKSQYEDQIIQLEVTERTTLTTPQIGGVTVPWGKNVSINVSYNGTNNQGISGADIDCDWDFIFYSVQDEGLGRYKLILNTTIKTIDTYMLKINASKDGYENREIYIPINIRNIYTNITYIQPEPVNFNSNVSIQLKFSDIDSNFLISGAELMISSEFDSQYWDSSKYFYFEPTLGTYNVTFDSSIFNGVGTFQIYTTLNRTYYSNASTLINIFIIDISTSLNLYLDGVDKTLEQSIELPIRSNFNITIKYTDAKTKYHIVNASIQLIGEGLSELLIENTVLKQYSIIINTAQLDIGVRFLTIYAQKANYLPYSILLRINVKRINTEITTKSGMSTINTGPGESVTLSIVLNDIDFNQTVKNASVTYTWAFGQGVLLDSDNDGIYEVILANLPVGTHTITISVYAGDDYDFKRFELTLNVIRHPENVILFQILTVLSVITALGVGGYLVAYQKVFKYPKTVRKIHKFKKSIKKGKKQPNVEIRSRKELIKKLYEESLGPLSKLKEDKNNKVKLK